MAGTQLARNGLRQSQLRTTEVQWLVLVVFEFSLVCAD